MERGSPKIRIVDSVTVPDPSSTFTLPINFTLNDPSTMNVTSSELNSFTLATEIFLIYSTNFTIDNFYFLPSSSTSYSTCLFCLNELQTLWVNVTNCKFQTAGTTVYSIDPLSMFFDSNDIDQNYVHQPL